MRPSTQSAPASVSRAGATCSAVNTSGMCNSIREPAVVLEAHASAEHDRAGRTGQVVPAADAVDVVSVAEVVAIETQREVAVHGVFHERIEDPVAWYPDRVGGTPEHRVHELRAAADL